MQLQPRAVASLTWNALARWLRAHHVSFPSLIREESTGLVVLGFHLQYGEPLSFFDCVALRVRATFRALRRGEQAQLDVRFFAAERTAATVRLLLCPVRIEERESLGATPAPLSEKLLARLAPDEIESGGAARVVPELRAGLETAGQLFIEGGHDFVVHRSRCEVAEQWAWTEVPALVEEAREYMALGTREPAARRFLGEPLRRLDIEFAQPLFSFDKGHVVTRGYLRDSRLGAVHRLVSARAAALLATAVETF